MISSDKENFNTSEVTEDKRNIDNIKLLSQNPKIKSLVKQIMEKLAREKKYKKNSIEMLSELKNELMQILEKQKSVN